METTTMDFAVTSMNSSWSNEANESMPMIQTELSPVQRALSVSLTVVIAITMLGVGCGVDVRTLKVHFVRPIGIIVGFVSQFLIMPVIAFALAKIFQMEDIETLGLLLLGASPGGTFSNIATFWASGDLSLSVAMTTMSNTLGLGMVPLLLFIFSKAFESSLVVPFETIGIALASLVGPILVGMGIRFKWPETAKKIVKILSAVGGITILGIVIALFVTYGNALQISSAQIGCAAIFPGLGMGLGYGLSSLASLLPKIDISHRQRRTICFETGIQNTQLAGAIIQLSFTFRQIVRIILFPVTYLISQMIWIAILLIGFRIILRIYPPESDDESTSEDDKKSRGSTKGETNIAFDTEPPPYHDVTVNAYETFSKL